MWIGPDNKLIEFKDPAIGVGATPVHWGISGMFLGGGGWSRRSNQSHKAYNVSWPFLRGEETSQIMEMLGYNETLNFWIATEYQVNALSAQASAPGVYLPDHLMSERVVTPTNGDNLPAYGRRFSQETSFRVGVIPAPDTDISFQWWGDGALLLVNRETGENYNLPAGAKEQLSPTVAPYDLIAGAGATVYGARMVIDNPHARNGWVLGQGNSGVRVQGDQPPQPVQYSAPSANNYQSLTLNLIETGDWDDLYS